MKVSVRITQSFKRRVKPFLKKYPSLGEELLELEKELISNPKMGKPLGTDSYKIRLSVKSKGKGKSGGLRVISHLDTEIIGYIKRSDGILVVNLISIDDKSETASITDKELKELIANI